MAVVGCVQARRVLGAAGHHTLLVTRMSTSRSLRSLDWLTFAPRTVFTGSDAKAQADSLRRGP